MIYEPAEDSELLLEAAMKEVKPEDEVIEIGAGSGFVAEKIRGKCKYIMVTDISPFATRALREKGFDVVQTDIARGVRKRFSLVLFNPPYLELEIELKRGFYEDCAIDGGKGGIEVICRFLDSLREIMDEGGRALLIVSSQNASRVFEKMKLMGFQYEIIAERRLFFEKILAIKIREQEQDR
ncbi:MAG: HemK2/MTQ2 family protein methyltransferase [Candidatus Methanoglobus sp.]